MVDVYKTLDFSKGLFQGDLYPINSKIYKLDDMLEKYNYPVNFDILVIDVEGGEYEVLKGFSINEWKPKMMIIELHEQYQNENIKINDKNINELMEKHNYKKIHSDSINSIFVLKI